MSNKAGAIGLAMAAAIGLGGGNAMAASISELYSGFYVLGDSLSDNGNLLAATGDTPPDPPYFEGRFSNGPVWNESILADFDAAGRPAANFAFGGARAIPNPEPQGGDTDPATDRVPDLPAQSQALLASAGGALAAGENDVVTLWFGGNDGLNGAGAPDQDARLTAAADAVVAAAGSLGAAGAENVVVFTIPDLGATPRFALFEPGTVAAARAATQTFNDTLAAGLAGMAGVELVDAGGLLAGYLADNPGLDPLTPCLFPDAQTAAIFGQPPICDDPSERLFYDGVHPTADVHAFIDTAVRDLLAPGPVAPAPIAPVPLPAGAPLLALAICLLGLGARRARG